MRWLAYNRYETNVNKRIKIHIMLNNFNNMKKMNDTVCFLYPFLLKGLTNLNPKFHGSFIGIQ